MAKALATKIPPKDLFAGLRGENSAGYAYPAPSQPKLRQSVPGTYKNSPQLQQNSSMPWM